MSNRTTTLLAATFAVLIFFWIVAELLPAHGQAKPRVGFAAVPAEKGGQDISGPYEVVPNWPKPMAQLPGHEKWTWGAIGGVFAESSNRVLIAQQGELPLIERPKPFSVGISLVFPLRDLPFRRASDTPFLKIHAADPKIKTGIDGRWEHCLLVLDAKGNIAETWTQWDTLFSQPHAIYLDPEKNVWVVDDWVHAIFKLTNDGKKLLQTIGTPNEPGDDDKHLGGPTALAWLPDGTMFVADGYVNSRVVKFSKEGKYLMAWGHKGNPPDEIRPGYFNMVHGIAVDPVARRVYVCDRSNRRIQVFDENGKFLDQWTLGPISQPEFLYISTDRHLWVTDAFSSKLLEYDLEGHFLYSWGSLGDAPGTMWEVHGMSVDQEGNLYLAEVGNGRVQKFQPRRGANPDSLVGGPGHAARE